MACEKAEGNVCIKNGPGVTATVEGTKQNKRKKLRERERKKKKKKQVFLGKPDRILVIISC